MPRMSPGAKRVFSSMAPVRNCTPSGLHGTKPISPGLLNTNIWRDIQAAAPDADACRQYWNANIPIARVIEPAEIGELAAFLLSDRSLCITGANIFADGGMTSQLISREPYASKHLTPVSR